MATGVGGLLIYRGFRYHCGRIGNAGQKYFVCATSHKTSCKARLVVSADGRVVPDEHGKRVRGTHCDEPNPHKIGAALIREEMIQKARAGMPTRQVLEEFEKRAAELATGVAANFPHKSTLQRMIQRIRREQLALPATDGGLRIVEAQNVGDIHVPVENTRNKQTQENLFLYDGSGTDGGGERFFMFGSKQTLQFLVNASTWLIDSTSLPDGMPVGQVWTIHACFESGGIGAELCAVFVFPHCDDYMLVCKEALQKLKEIGPEIAPKLIFADLSDSERTAITEVLGETDDLQVLSTWINLFRRLDDAVGGAASAETGEINSFARALSMLALAPPDNVEKALILLENKSPSNSAEKFAQLFEHFRQEFAPAVTLWNCWSIFSDSLSPAHFFPIVEVDQFHRQLETKLEARKQNAEDDGTIGFVNDVVPLIVRELELAEVRGLRKASVTRNHTVETKEGRIYARMQKYKSESSKTSAGVIEYLFEMVELIDALKY